MAIGLALVPVDVLVQVVAAVRGRRNPWGAGTLEGAMTPPPSGNFASLPEVGRRERAARRPRDPARQHPDADGDGRGDGGVGSVRVALALGWAGAIGARIVLLRVLRSRRRVAPSDAEGAADAGLMDRLIWMMVWLGLVATVWTLSPVLATTTCGDGAAP